MMYLVEWLGQTFLLTEKHYLALLVVIVISGASYTVRRIRQVGTNGSHGKDDVYK